MAQNVQKNYICELANEIMINIFKYVDYPKDLSISCKQWFIIARDDYAKTEWIIRKFGLAHCLFHSIRLGSTFINVAVAQKIISKGGILSRYLIQWLINDKTTSWVNNLSSDVFMFLLNKAYNTFKDDLHQKGNDMRDFYNFSGGSYTINLATIILNENFEKIKFLILCMKFIPLPSYRNRRVIARSIFLRKDLVLLWKKIGYHEIYEDFGDLVIQETLDDVFSQIQHPNVETVIVQLNELVDLGFQVNYKISIKLLHHFEHQLENVGEIIITAFIEMMQEVRKSFINKCFMLLENPNLNQNILNFLYNLLPDNSESK
ncbi:20137_t:CDS:1 [Cetraspora pellucida]|uniref:20137_t:CDS:1 n=1 Tax=Cetraspora pellucida TaxID=1433469 RepID=A0A9N9B5I0_9GLOM|nr:20137_t:CDS:1 [Cetraspora pellucida]